MAMTIHVDIVSAEGQLFSGQGEMVYAPAVMGEIGIAPRHAPLVSPLKPGEVRIDPGQGKEMEHFYVSGGLIEVQPFKVTVLADTGVRAVDLDEAAALEAKRRAEDALANQAADMDLARAQAELAEAIAQLRAIERLRKGKGK
ncbi:F0F1 ATP synthase subunit epsilon [endosymbiont of unidentified scaly snail isolate Monju]|uniref:F0F1 ATP synthase subunit epsilon n=1 Tax=endosymbiont of unidentified scaly snail isolate Monju TaxID=1248727 RepID=UPI0005BAC8D5|nr:F0F1 ATP synthase subunit epsilon [endosymbiont of unidentified scaly snail isolate Monju]